MRHVGAMQRRRLLREVCEAVSIRTPQGAELTTLPALTEAERDMLSAAATNLRKGSRCVVIACEKHEVGYRLLLSWWPTRRLETGFAIGSESEQAEDDRLRLVTRVGNETLARLQARAPDDALVALAATAFRRSAEHYIAVSSRLHADRSTAPATAIDQASRHLQDAVTTFTGELAKSALGSDECFEPLPAPAGIVAAADLLAADVRLAGLGGRPALQLDPRQHLAAHVEGTISLVAQHVSDVPENVVHAAKSMRVALERWDEVSGSFRGVLADLAGDSPAADPYRVDADMEVHVNDLGVAADEMTWRVLEVSDCIAARPRVAVPALVEDRVARAHALQENRVAPAGMPAFDDVHRVFALGVTESFGPFAAECFDNRDLLRHDLGRALVRAHRAADEYLSASDGVARRLRDSDGTSAPDPTQAARDLEAVMRAVRRRLQDEATNTIVAATVEMARSDAEWACVAGEPASPGGDPRWWQNVAVIARRRACKGARHVLGGDAAAHLRNLTEGPTLLARLESACDRLERAVGVRYAAMTVSSAATPATVWLAEAETSRLEVRRNVDAARLRPLQNERFSGRERGPAVS